MQYNIEEIKVKIHDTIDANILDICISNDTGAACSIQFNLLHVVERSKGVLPSRISMSTGSVKIKDSDYIAYNTAPDRLLYAAEYIAAYTTPNLVILD